MRIPCNMEVRGDRVIFDLSEAPPQVPSFINSKEYIIRAQIAPRLRQLLAPGLPYNQAILDIVEIICKPGTIVHCVMPAPIGAAHMDAAMAVYTAAGQCMQLALHASPRALEREKATAPSLSAYGTGRWSYLDHAGARRVYTLIDGAFSGSPAGAWRDGIDIKSSQIPGGNQLEYADVEILEAAYPLLFEERRATDGSHGYGQYRSGLGCQESFFAHNTDSLVGNMTGTRAWFPSTGAAGGMPGATMRFAVTRADGKFEPIDIHQVGVALAPGDRFEMYCASGGGFGDPLDREPEAVLMDMSEDRLDAGTAGEIYGVVLGAAGELDLAATEVRRDAIRRDRLAQAQPALRRLDELAHAGADAEPETPLYPGVAQVGRRAVSEASRAVLAYAPDNWLDGCPTLDMAIDERAGGTVARAHLDPVNGRMLFVDVIRTRDGPSIEVRPHRWAEATEFGAGHNLPKHEGAGQ